MSENLPSVRGRTWPDLIAESKIWPKVDAALVHTWDSLSTFGEGASEGVQRLRDLFGRMNNTYAA